MAEFPFDIVVFDLDGTLADTTLDLAAALNHTLAGLGRPTLPPEQVRDMVGHGARALLQRGLAATGACNDALIEHVYPIFIEYYSTHIADRSHAFSGVNAALAALDTAGVRLAICTNKPEALTRKLVDTLGWGGRFTAIVGGDTLPQRKPDPAPVLAAIVRAGGGRAAFVGDSISDTEASRAAGIPCIAVTFGFSDLPPAQLGATALIDDFASLVPTLRAIG